MKKWIAMFVFGGAVSTFGLVGSTTQPSAQLGIAATEGELDPCPSCCPVQICGINGPSFDGTTEPSSR